MSEADPKIIAETATPVAEADVQVGLTDDPPAQRTKKRWPRFALMLSVPLLLLLVGGYFWLTSGRWVSTDNAYLQRDMVSVSSEVSGPIAEVLVRENQRVRRGDVLFRIDPRPFRIALAQAEAQLAAARVQVNQLETRSAGTGADITGAEANLQFAESDFDRYRALLGRGFTTRARYDQAQHAVAEARERLANARADAATAHSALAGGGQSNEPAIRAAMVARDQALLNLARTEVRAPSDGIVSQTDRLQIGGAAVTGVPTVTIVRSDQVWVEANYKETDLANMYVGQPVEIALDAYPGVTVRGHVASIGAGTGAQFSVLPAQNASGNWVKVTQRVPVRIAIDSDPGRPLIAGLSADVSVDTQNRPAQQAGR